MADRNDDKALMLVEKEVAMQERSESALGSPPDGETALARRGPSGCAWGVLGALGCLVVVLVALGTLLAIGTTTVGSVLDGIGVIFRPTERINISALVLERVEGLSQLTTARYNVIGLTDIERDFPPPLNLIYGESAQLQIVGHVTAGVDLSQLDEEDISVVDGVLRIQLPPPQLQDCFLNEQETVVLDRDQAPLAFATGQEDLIARARRFAVERIRDIALEDGILNSANEQATVALEELFTRIPLGEVTRVEVVAAQAPAAPTLPPSCQVAAQ